MLPVLTGVALSFFFALASAHGRIAQITTSTGQVYKGWDAESSQSLTPPSPLAAWSAANLGNIFVPPSQFNTPNITCHFNAIPGALHVNTTAGDELQVKWNEWPVSHVGPVMTHIAKCNSSCAEVNKDDLLWVKIDELAWLNNTGADKLQLGGTLGDRCAHCQQLHLGSEASRSAGRRTLCHETRYYRIACSREARWCTSISAVRESTGCTRDERATKEP